MGRKNSSNNIDVSLLFTSSGVWGKMSRNRLSADNVPQGTFILLVVSRGFYFSTRGCAEKASFFWIISKSSATLY